MSTSPQSGCFASFAFVPRCWHGFRGRSRLRSVPAFAPLLSVCHVDCCGMPFVCEHVECRSRFKTFVWLTATRSAIVRACPATTASVTWPRSSPAMVYTLATFGILLMDYCFMCILVRHVCLRCSTNARRCCLPVANRHVRTLLACQCTSYSTSCSVCQGQARCTLCGGVSASATALPWLSFKELSHDPATRP